MHLLQIGCAAPKVAAVREYAQSVRKHGARSANASARLCCLCVAKPRCQTVFFLHVHRHSCRDNRFAGTRGTLSLTSLSLLQPLLAREQHAMRTQRTHGRSKRLIDAFKLFYALLFGELGRIRFLLNQATRSDPDFMRCGHGFARLVKYCLGIFGRLKASKGEPKLYREWNHFNSAGEEDTCVRG
jgi:hypothetical protein